MADIIDRSTVPHGNVRKTAVSFGRQLSLAPQRRKTISSSARIGSIFPSCYFNLIVFLVIMQIPQTTPKEMQQLMCKFLRYKENCHHVLNETWNSLTDNGTNNVTYCPGGFDGYICWPHGKPGIVRESCPEFIDWTNDSLEGFRYCHDNGSWFQTEIDGEMKIWNHRGQCNPFVQSEDYPDDPSVDGEESVLNALITVYTIGYYVSLVCLVCALLLLTFFKKLHCTRNYIHINLMISFIIRYVAVLVKDKVVAAQYDTNRFKDNLTDDEMKLYCDDFGGVSGVMISCRLTITLMHYAIVANYFWLLAEGIYLQLILVFVMSENKYFPMFMAFGWGAPWIPVGVWVALRLTLENVGCWELFSEYNIWWALRIPVILSIAINFFIFVNIIRIIVSKLRANNMSRVDYKYRLARSTLALIPLLGIHYIIFLVITNEVVGPNKTAMHVKLAFEMIFTSIQGSLISILYCFLNGEVQAEIKKLWNHWRWRNDLPATKSRKCSTYNSSGTQMTSVTCQSAELNANHDMTLLSPMDGRESGLNSRRSTGTSEVARMTTNETAHPLIGNGHSSLNIRKAENSV